MPEKQKDDIDIRARCLDQALQFYVGDNSVKGGDVVLVAQKFYDFTVGNSDFIDELDKQGPQTISLGVSL